MLPIHRITTPLSTVWRNMPTGSATLCVTALSYAIATRFTFNKEFCKEIRAAILLVGGLLFLAQKVSNIFKDEIEELREAPPQPAVDVIKDPTSYLNLLPNKLLQKTGNFLDYATKHLLEAHPITDHSLDQIRQGLNANIEGSEDQAQRALASEGIFISPYFGETALNTLRRHRAVTAPESRVFQGRAVPLKMKKFTFVGLFQQVIGPLIIFQDQPGVVAYNWTKGAVQWIQPSGIRINALMDYRTGEYSAYPGYVNKKTFEHVEVRGLRNLFNRNLEQEIILNHDCERILHYQHPYLVFESEGEIWIKDGNNAEFSTDMSYQQAYSCIPLFQPPYMIIFSGDVGQPAKVYSLTERKHIYEIPDVGGFSATIQQRAAPESDTLRYFPIDDDFSEIQVSLKDFTQTTLSTENALRSYLYKQGALLLDETPRLGPKMGISYPNRPFTSYPKAPYLQLAAVHNSYILFRTHNSSLYYVIDLARNSLPDQPRS